MLAHIYKGGEGDKVKDETVVDLIWIFFSKQLDAEVR